MKRLAIAVVLCGTIYILLWVAIANPFNFFVPRSEHFSLERFRRIRVGSSIEEAVKDLGKPVVVTKEDRFDPSCPACVAYCFMGEPPRWVIGFQEAWLIADQQGKVVRVFMNTEP